MVNCKAVALASKKVVTYFSLDKVVILSDILATESKTISLYRSVVEISVGCRRKPTGFHKKADRPIVKNGKKADRLLHKVVKYVLMNSTVPVFTIV